MSLDRSTVLELDANRRSQDELVVQMAELKRRITDLEDRLFRLQRGAPSSGGGAGSTTVVYQTNPTEIGRIILYYDGLFALYDPNEERLNAALADASTGDTVWIPSVTIDCVAGISVPDGVALIAISGKSKLNFTGFDGVGVTLGVDSVLDGFEIEMTGVGAAGCVGVRAETSGARVEHCDIRVAGGLTNRRLEIGL